MQWRFGCDSPVVHPVNRIAVVTAMTRVKDRARIRAQGPIGTVDGVKVGEQRT